MVCNRNVWSVVVNTSQTIFVSVSLAGPTVIDRTQIEFYCDISTNTTDPRARFNVTFLFGSQADDGIPVQVLTTDNPRATLHERYLAGRLNKAVRLWISQSVTYNSKTRKAKPTGTKQVVAFVQSCGHKTI